MVVQLIKLGKIENPLKEGKIINKLSKKESSFLLPKGNLNNSYNINDRFVKQFLSNASPCSHDFCHELSLISEEIDSLYKIIN